MPNNVSRQTEEVLNSLKDKERQILVNRFGLLTEKGETLASIGKGLDLTRERIRQIQNSALQKIKNSSSQEEGIFAEVKKLSLQLGGVISVKDIEKELGAKSNYALFLLEANRNLKRIKGYKNLSSTFINNELEARDIINAEKDLIKLLKNRSKAVSIAKLISLFQTKNKMADETIKSILKNSTSFARDWQGRVGLSIWREVNPKSARDKAFYILKKEERPLHFTHIADLIERQNFLGKNPTPATVHNELILDPRFVLVGRGIYALKSWGFRGGTVEEVIAEVLAEHPQGLQRDVIIEEVLKNKLVARNTVMMNLLIKKQFSRDEKGMYKLAKS